MAKLKRTPRGWRYDVAERGSTAVQTLEAAWQLLCSIHSEIPPAVLTFVDVKSRTHFRGYFAWSIWNKRRGKAHEIGISPTLIGSPKQLLATMLHEAAHAVLYESGDNGGIGSGGYYHLKSFRDKCFEFGLECEFLNTRYGFTLTSWPNDVVPKRFQPVVHLLRKELPSGTGKQEHSKLRGRDLPLTGHTILSCGCDEGRRTVYVKKSVLEAGGIVCAFCKCEFEPIN